MFFLKAVILFFAIVIVWHMVRLARLGKAVASGDKGALASHRGTVACVGCLTLIMVVLIEALVQTNPVPYTAPGWLLAFHFAVDALLVIVFFAMAFRFTGLRWPSWHGRLAHSFFVLFALSLTSGTALMWQL